jgi:hypothetical protein
MNGFYREGEFWTMAFDGEIARLRDARGLALLSQLLRQPGRELHVLDLANRRGTGADYAEPILDGTGRSRFRDRIAELEADLEEADRFGDTERSARTQDELDAVVDELARATGLGGRDRRTTSESERARVATTRAIRLAMRHISNVLPDLAHHLQHSVKTGTYCVYAPDVTTGIEWRLDPPAVEDDDMAGTMPARLALEVEARAAFVGRHAEREMLDDTWRGVAAGRPHVGLVAGEPGIGKTRLVAEFAFSTSGDGALIGYGRCDEETAQPYGPFTEMLDHLIGAVPTAALERHVAQHGVRVAAIAPALLVRLPQQADPPTEVRANRAQLFHAVASLLRDLSEMFPVILIMDDMHWGDGASLALFRHLASADTGRTLLVGTYRDSQLGRSYALIGLLAALRRHAGVSRVHMAGLSADEVSELAVAAGVDISGELYERTGGNPFFATELLRSISEGHGGLPAGVSETVRARVERLPGAAPRILRLAAILGHEFRLDVLTRLAGVQPGTVLRVMEQGLAASLVTEIADGIPTFAFEHALIRDALYEDASAARRAQMHLLAAETMERLVPDDLRAIAHHFVMAPMPPAAERAASYSLRAAVDALEAFAYEDAMVLARQGIGVAEAHLAANPLLMADLLVALGRAEIGDGRPDAGKGSLRRAHVIERRVGSPRLLADVALAFGSLSIATTAAEVAEPVAILREAIAAQDEADGALRVRLLSALTRWLSFVAPRPERMQLEHEALSMARRIGADALVADALVAALYNRSGPDDAADQCALADELEACSGGADDEKRLLALLYRAFGALQQGRHAVAAAAEDEFMAASRPLLSPFFVLYSIAIQGRRACVAGDFATAEHLADSMERAAATAGWDNSAPIDMQADQLWAALYLQGRFDDLASLVSRDPAPNEPLPFVRGMVVAVERTGSADPDDLRRIDALITDETMPFWWHLAPFLVHICVRLGNRAEAEALYQRLEPWADLDMVSEVQSFHGSVQHHLGVLALTMGRGRRAVRHLTEARRRHEAAGSPPWVRLTTGALARAQSLVTTPGVHSLSVRP